MSYLGTKDFALEAARLKVAGYATVNKFGEAQDADSGVATDVWDGADGVTSTNVWVAPTQARTHDITSTDANDTSAGTGLRTVRVFGLVDWDSAESSEDVTMNGTSNVATASAYVIIHRKVGLTFGSGDTNAGIITATAQTDATVTAAMQAGEGQTLMAIYGVPSTQKLFIEWLNSTVLRAGGGGAGATADMTLLVKENADQADSSFVTKGKWQLSDAVPLARNFKPPKKATGPCIVKLQVNTNTNNSKVTGEIDAYVVDD